VKKIADERCSQCGTPAWWAYSTDNMIQFKVEDHTCQACAVREAAEEAQEKRQPGTVKIVRTVPAFDDEPLPTRQDFYESLAKRAEWEAKVKADPSLLELPELALQPLSNDVTETIE
jgi:hypothetical protein